MILVIGEHGVSHLTINEVKVYLTADQLLWKFLTAHTRLGLPWFFFKIELTFDKCFILNIIIEICILLVCISTKDYFIYIS